MLKIGFKDGLQRYVGDDPSAAQYVDVVLDAPVGFDSLTDFASVDANNVITIHTKTEFEVLKNNRKLVIDRVVSESSTPLIESFPNFTIKIPSNFVRGRKERSDYIMPTDRKLAVTKHFEDVRDVNGLLTALRVKFDFYREDGTIGETWEDSVKEFSPYEAEEMEEMRRNRQFAYLRASVKNTPHESYITTLFNHYTVQIASYKENGGPVLKDAIEAETDANILAILDTMLTRNDDPTKEISVRNSLLYQMGYYILDES